MPKKIKSAPKGRTSKERAVVESPPAPLPVHSRDQVVTQTARSLFVPARQGDGHQVEALHSYISALASTNAITIAELAAYMGEATLVDRPGAVSRRVWLPKVMPSLSGHSSRTRAALLLMERVGIPGLRCTTFHQWRDVSGEASGRLFRNQKRWCSSCWDQDVASGKRPFMRLLWCADMMKHCVVHLRQLSSTCPNCSKEQTSWHSKDLIRCTYCRSDLRFGSGNESPVQSLSAEEAQLVDLVEHGVANPETEHYIANIVLFIYSYQQRIKESGEHRLRFWTTTRRDEGWIRLQKRASIPGLVRLSAYTGISVLLMSQYPFEAAEIARLPWEKKKRVDVPNELLLRNEIQQDFTAVHKAAEMRQMQMLWIPGPFA